VLLVAEAQEDADRDVSFRETPAEDRQRRDTDAAAHEDRTRSAMAELPGLGESVAEGASYPHLLPLLQLAEAVSAWADALDEEVEAGAVVGRSSFGYGEGAG
jgi:hypothetical protein